MDTGYPAAALPLWAGMEAISPVRSQRSWLHFDPRSPPHTGPRLAAAGSIRDEIVRTIEGQVGFVVHAWRRVADHLFAWINRDRRPVKDVMATITSTQASLSAAPSIIAQRRPAR